MSAFPRATVVDRGTLQKGMVDLYAAVGVGAGGAVTLQQWNYPGLPASTTARTYTAAPSTGGGTGYPQKYQQGAEGVRSVARTAAGLWTVTLQDNVQRLLELRSFSRLAGGLSLIVGCAENTTISNYGAAGGTIIGVALLSASGAALDPANGETVILHFALQAATAP